MNIKVAAVLIAAAFGAVPGEAAQDQEAAKVNGEVLTWETIRSHLTATLKPEAITPDLLQEKRRELVGSILIRQYAERHKLTVSDAEVDKIVARERSGYRSEEDHQRHINVWYRTRAWYRENLRWQELKLLVLRDALARADKDPLWKDAGFSPAAVPEETQRRYYMDHEAEFQKAFEQVSFARIGLQWGPGQRAQKQVIAESLLRRLEKGTEFTMLAYFYSDVARAKGFRDRAVSRADLKDLYQPETIAYLFDELKAGETSPIMADGNTLNIFRMEQKLKQGPETFEEAQNRIRDLLQTQVRVANLDKLILALRKSAKIEPAGVFEDK